MKFMPFFWFLSDFKLIFRLIFPLKIAKKTGGFYFIPQTPRRLTWRKHSGRADVARGTTTWMRRGTEATWQRHGWLAPGAGGEQGADTWQEATQVHADAREDPTWRGRLRSFLWLEALHNRPIFIGRPRSFTILATHVEPSRSINLHRTVDASSGGGSSSNGRQKSINMIAGWSRSEGQDALNLALTLATHLDGWICIARTTIVHQQAWSEMIGTTHLPDLHRTADGGRTRTTIVVRSGPDCDAIVAPLRRNQGHDHRRDRGHHFQYLTASNGPQNRARILL